MPAVKIELLEGKSQEALFSIRDTVMDAVVESLQLPTDDRNIRIITHKPGYFQMKAPYELLIEISLFKGRTKETKKKLYQNIVTSLEKKNLATKESVFIILNEISQENWGIRGGIPADEITLNFKIDI
jgi:phenylpyruvate tautomerase PptA (4-oxalocrotonate tautomerase family)